jgi:hypothetical protein
MAVELDQRACWLTDETWVELGLTRDVSGRLACFRDNVDDANCKPKHDKQCRSDLPKKNLDDSSATALYKCTERKEESVLRFVQNCG